MNTMDLDDITFGSTKAERENEIAIRLLKLGQNIKIHLDACVSLHQKIIGYIPKAYEKYLNWITESHYHFENECDELLKLTGHKTTTKYTDSVLRKGRNREKKLRDTVALSRKRKITPEEPLDLLKAMNTKLKEKKAEKKVEKIVDRDFVSEEM